ncbi:ABC transporter substrate-binding protein [Massilia sp. TS11]|uniref:substrate-binding periplasmic protein n=1 Tax=Massilia sp. TS11 TaxID=2908003 RepID=UPI001EDB1C31|nr:transporter substrate-binding domain-containing protein [Massilia sp. TS11]MCG2585957.1 transporter substrate-binding domain-containing protein [Massilia sp. TS11]
MRPARLLPLLLAGVLATAAAATPVRYLAPPPDSPSDAYPIAVLRLALERSGQHYTLQAVHLRMVQERELTEVAKAGGQIDILSSMTTHERELALLPVRIPIDKGLLGWRIALTRDAQQMRAVRALPDLARLRAGQGAGWPDADILRANGLPVLTAPFGANLVQMLDAGRFDYYPLSLLEVNDAQQLHPALAVDPYLVLHYPAALYFFVRKDNLSLAEAVRRGLEKAIADGSFERLFQQTFGADLRRARLSERRILHLKNPLLPAATPLARKELWLTPQ